MELDAVAVEHEPWRGQDYGCLDGKRILIAGFSHHGEPHEESTTFTIDLIPKILGGGIAFFDRVASAFGSSTQEGFWNRVAFMNTLPSLVGPAGQRYAAGTCEQRAAAAPRATRAIHSLAPDKVFVFTRKGWNLWPVYDCDIPHGLVQPAEGERIQFRSYARPDGGQTSIYGLRHPQYARQAGLTAAIRAVMDHDPTGRRLNL